MFVILHCVNELLCPKLRLYCFLLFFLNTITFSLSLIDSMIPSTRAPPIKGRPSKVKLVVPMRGTFSNKIYVGGECTWLLMAWPSLVSRSKMVSVMTLYWKPSTWMIANWCSGLGGYSIPTAGLWMTSFACWGSFTSFYLKQGLPPVTMLTLWFVPVSFSSSPKVFANDRWAYSTNISSCAASTGNQKFLSYLVSRKIMKTWLHGVIITEERSLGEEKTWRPDELGQHLEGYIHPQIYILKLKQIFSS